jgi:hypothetical protein
MVAGLIHKPIMFHDNSFDGLGPSSVRIRTFPHFVQFGREHADFFNGFIKPQSRTAERLGHFLYDFNFFRARVTAHAHSLPPLFAAGKRPNNKNSCWNALITSQGAIGSKQRPNEIPEPTWRLPEFEMASC